MDSSSARSVLLVAALGYLVAINRSAAQQNGEVMVPSLARGQLDDDGNRARANKLAVEGGGGSDLMKVQYVNVNGQPVLVQFTYVGPPKILPIATADSYPEGATINLMCTISGGQREGLVLSWRLNGQELLDQRSREFADLDNVSIGPDDTDISILKIRNATSNNSGLYTCMARNSLGQDSTTVKIVVNVDLKWTKMPKDVEIGLNQEVSVECGAVGSPEPTIEWLQHASNINRASISNGTKLVSKGRILKIAKAQIKDSGLYECVARNGAGEDLRKVIQVKIRGK